jgi:predicted DNA-binding ribbon-helix-helix protein
MERLRRLSDIKDCSALERSRNKHLVLGSDVRSRAGAEVRSARTFAFPAIGLPSPLCIDFQFPGPRDELELGELAAIGCGTGQLQHRRAGMSNDEQGNYAVRKRSLALFGRKTSVSLEDPFWEALKEVAEARRTNRNALINAVAKDHQGNLSSALRVLAVEHFRAATRTKRRVRK